MKKIAILIFILLTAGCAGNRIIVKEFKPEHIIHHSDLKTLESIADLNNYIVYLDKGDVLPIEFSFDTNIIGINDTKLDMIAKRKLFFMLKMPENLSKEELTKLENLDKEKISEMSETEKRKCFKNFMLYISKDAVEWAPVYNIKAIKKVFGIKGGTVSFGMGMSNKKGIQSYFDIKEAK